MTTKQKEAYKLLNSYVKAKKFLNKKLDKIRTLDTDMKVQMRNLIEWCELLEISYNRIDWDGNTSCGSNWDEVFFDYKGCHFFELVEKEEI